jgi:hypothetical protein
MIFLHIVNDGLTEGGGAQLGRALHLAVEVVGDGFGFDGLAQGFYYADFTDFLICVICVICG